MKKLVLIISILTVVIYSCSDEENTLTPTIPEVNEGKTLVSFAIESLNQTKSDVEHKTEVAQLIMQPGMSSDVEPLSIEVEQIATKSYQALMVDSTLRVVVYKRRPGGTTPDPALDQFIATNTYVVTSSWNLMPSLVDSAGSAKSGKASPLYLMNDTYDFYAYTPAIPLSNDSLIKVNNGYDFATAIAENITIDELKTNVVFPNLERQMARIQFTIEPDQSYPDVQKLEIDELGMNLLQTTKTPYTLKLGDSIVASVDTTDNHVIEASKFMQMLPNQIMCFDYVLPKIPGALYLYFNLAINGLDQTYIAIMPNVTFKNGFNYIYKVLIKQKGATAVEQANCYMVLPNQSLTFPVAQSVNGGANLLYPWSASVYWQTTPSFLSVKNISQSNGTITVSTNGTGNGLVVLKQFGQICWSWHIWGTDYNPSLTSDFAASGNVLEVEGGEVHRYNNEFFANTSKVIMDRNLGAQSAAEGSPNAYGMLYQWGRKDPFLPKGTKVTGMPNSTNGGPVRLQTAISNPTVFYYSGFIYYNWAVYPGQYWTDNTKTIFDPCPPGWRVPSDDVWSGIKQSDIVQDPTGAGIIYEPAHAYFPFTGQRGYEYGNFKNIGVAGYQWSTDESSGIIDFVDYAESFYFTKIGINDVDDLPKASGLSVRCVQE